jgi:hypothetical protein
MPVNDRLSGGIKHPASNIYLMFLLDDILLAPVNGFKFIMKQIQQLADKELNDESVIKEQLLELQMRLELEEISEDDYAEAERELFARLRAIKARQLEALGQVHTASTSSMVVEAGGDAEAEFYEPGEGH